MQSQCYLPFVLHFNLPTSLWGRLGWNKVSGHGYAVSGVAGRVGFESRSPQPYHPTLSAYEPSNTVAVQPSNTDGFHQLIDFLVT